MKIFAKTALLITGAATLAASMPAYADSRHRGNDRIDAGDVIAGALIIGGIAAIASAGSNNRGRYNDRYDDRRYSGNDGYYNNDGNGYYQNGYGSRPAVDQCVRAAQRDADRYGRARITDVTSINRIRGGYEIRGRLVVEQRGYGRRGHDNWNQYGNSYDRYNDGYDKGRFSCVTRHGQVADLRIGGLRNTY
ncbi:MAG: hypothetical protein ABL918_00945 [Chakrabartia sp.]